MQNVILVKLNGKIPTALYHQLLTNFKTMNLLKPFKRFWNWLNEDNRKKDLQIAVQIVQNIKYAVDGKLASTLVDIIPGDKDNLIRHKLSVILTEALHWLKLVSKAAINNDALKQAVEAIQAMPKEERKSYYNSIAGWLTSELTKLPIETAIIKANEFYRNEFVDETEIV